MRNPGSCRLKIQFSWLMLHYHTVIFFFFLKGKQLFITISDKSKHKLSLTKSRPILNQVCLDNMLPCMVSLQPGSASDDFLKSELVTKSQTVWFPPDSCIERNKTTFYIFPVVLFHPNSCKLRGNWIRKVLICNGESLHATKIKPHMKQLLDLGLVVLSLAYLSHNLRRKSEWFRYVCLT